MENNIISESFRRDSLKYRLNSFINYKLENKCFKGFWNVILNRLKEKKRENRFWIWGKFYSRISEKSI